MLITTKNYLQENRTMDHSHSTTTSHKKGKHLTYAERVLIQIRLKDNYCALINDVRPILKKDKRPFDTIRMI